MAAITKIEISSNGPICSILSQKVPKFELYCVRQRRPVSMMAAITKMKFLQMAKTALF